MYKLVKSLTHAGQGEASIGQCAKAIFWSFFGVRKAKDHHHDAAQISPTQAIVAGVVGTAVVVVTLLTLVSFVIGPQDYDKSEINELRELSLTVDSPNHNGT